MPGEYRRKSNLTMNTLEQTAAQWAVDTRIHDVNVVLVPTDGADQGKHKMADGLKTYAELSFVEDSSTPSTETIQVTPYLYLTAGEAGSTAIYEQVGTANGKPWYRQVGASGSPDSNNPTSAVIWSDPGSGFQWSVTNASADILYASTSAVATPDLATGWTAESGIDTPTPSIFLVAGPSLQEALEQITEQQTRPVLRTGSTIAFDAQAIYNSPTTPSSGSVTLDLSGATPCSVVAYFNHSSEPSWPSGVEAVGAWNNSALNVVVFVYQDSSNISASINSDAAVSTTNGGWPRIDKTVTEIRTSSTTLTADTDLQFSMVANGKYQVRCKLWGGVSGTGPGWKYGFTGPASPTLVRASGHHLSSVATPPTNYTQNAYETTGKVFPSSAAGLHSVDLDFYIENGANAGNFQITWAQNASSGTAASMGRGSFVEYVRVA